MHVYDGVIQRQTWYGQQLKQQDDLNAQGNAIRRLTYDNGKLAKRDYLDGAGNLVSEEWFDAEGFITRSLGLWSHHTPSTPAWKRDGSTTLAEWGYERGEPMRYRRGPKEIVKEGGKWVRKR